MNYDLLSFSRKLSQQRIEKAKTLLGKRVVDKILGYALFLLGVDKTKISSFLDMKPGTLRTIVHALHTHGLAALEDRRSKTSTFKPTQPLQTTPTLDENEYCVKIDLGIRDMAIQIPKTNPIQIKVFLLTLLDNALLKCSDIADTLHLSEDRTKKLSGKLAKEDVPKILDQRCGQKQDYLFKPEIKGEIIQQFVLNAATQDRITGEQIAKKLEERCQLKLSPRSILYHFSKLGLNHIKEALLGELAELKKNSSRS